MILVLILLVSAVSASNEPGEIVVNHVERTDDVVADTDLVLAFVIFRHGDRTPDDEELDLNQSQEQKTKKFFPYGLKALTNAGKMRGYRVGEFLRRRYDGFLSRLYLPNEISVRCTGYDRTKMTALTALAALYVPPPAQKWNPNLDWQPVPYDVLPNTKDDLLYWYFCPRYLWLRNLMYERPEVQQKLKSYGDLYKKLSEYTKTNISTPEDVFYLDNLFQAEENVGIRPPKWTTELMPQIKEMTRIEFELEFYTDELIRLASGVLVSSILDEIDKVIRYGDKEPSPKMRLYSAHENNVAALMAAVRVFRPHQPKYGATFAMELRRQISTGAYGIVKNSFVADSQSSNYYHKKKKMEEDSRTSIVEDRSIRLQNEIDLSSYLELFRAAKLLEKVVQKNFKLLPNRIFDTAGSYNQTQPTESY